MNENAANAQREAKRGIPTSKETSTPDAGRLSTAWRKIVPTGIWDTDVVGGFLLHGEDETFWIAQGILTALWWKVM